MSASPAVAAGDDRAAVESVIEHPHPAIAFINDLYEPTDFLAFMVMRSGEAPIHLFVTVAEAATPSFVAKLTAKNNDGFNVYVAMNVFKAGNPRRTIDNVAAIRNVWTEIDEDGRAKLEKIFASKLVPDPTVVLESSPERFQFIWKVTGLTAAEASVLVKSLTSEFGGDPNATDLARVLRVPGFKNHKYADKPIVEVVHLSEAIAKRYTKSDFTIPPQAVSTTPTAKDIARGTGEIPVGMRDNVLTSIAGTLRDAGCDEEAIYNHLVNVNAARCPVPKDDADLRRIAHSMAKHESGIDRRIKETPLIGGVPAGTPKVPSTEPLTNSNAGTNVGLQAYSEIKTKKLVWLWPGRIPLGKLTLAVGNPDQGKSLFVIDLASLISTGNTFPDGTENLLPPSSVILCEAEDDCSDTIGPRLQAAGADVSKVFRMHSIVAAEKDSQGAVYMKERMVQFDTDLQLIENTIRNNPEIRLLIVSPLSGYIGEANLIDDKAVRKALTPLQEMAGRLNIAIVAVMHLNKSAEFDVIYRISGAMGFVAVARATWLFCSDKNDSEKHYMLQVKGNLAKKANGLVYRIKTRGVQVEDATIEQPYISWEGDTMEDANEVMRASCGLQTNKKHVEDARYWLTDIMRQHNWLIDRVTLGQLAEQSQIPTSALERAKRSLGVRYNQKEQSFFMQAIAEDQNTPVPW